jgi:ABC-type sugar transport system substrate-binding protein
MSFVPPRPSELAAPATSTAPSASPSPASAAGASRSPAAPKAAARLVELILSQPPDMDRLYLEQFLRRDSGIKKCAFRSVKPDKEQPKTPAQLAQEIRAAANRGAGAVILEAIDAPEVRDALREAGARGTAIVLLDTPLPSPSPGIKYPYVTVEGFTEAGQEVVQTLIEEAKRFGRPADGTALVIHNTHQDFYSRRRFESITGALKAAGRAYEIMEFDGDQQAVTDRVYDYLKSHPKLAILLADEDFGLGAAFHGRLRWLKEDNHPVPVVGGYAANDARLDLLVKERVSAMADRNVEGYARAALQLALDQMGGKTVPERVALEMPIVYHHPDVYPSPEGGQKPGQGSGPNRAGDQPARPPASPPAP